MQEVVWEESKNLCIPFLNVGRPEFGLEINNLHGIYLCVGKTMIDQLTGIKGHLVFFAFKKLNVEYLFSVTAVVLTFYVIYFLPIFIW